MAIDPLRQGYHHTNHQNLFALDEDGEGGRMCGPAILTRLLSSRRSEQKSEKYYPGDLNGFAHGMMSMELGADTESQTSIPKVVGRGGYFSTAELEQVEKDRKAALSSHVIEQRESSDTLGTHELTDGLSSDPSSPAESSSQPRFRVRVTDTSNGEVVTSEGSLTCEEEEESLVSERSLLATMRTVLEQQQAALLEIAQQNQQFKATLLSYQQETKMLREEATTQKIRMAQLTLQKESIENESINLKTKVSILESQLEEKEDLRQRFEDLMTMDGDESVGWENDDNRERVDSFEQDILNITPLPSEGEKTAQRSQFIPELSPYPFSHSPRGQARSYSQTVGQDEIEVSIRERSQIAPSRQVSDFKSRLDKVQQHRRERDWRHEI